MTTSGRPARILLVEDNPADVKLVQMALEEAESTSELIVIPDGEQALAFFNRLRSGLEPRPDLVFLDLNLPRVGGLEVLVVVKSEPALSALPVIVFSTSRADTDVRAAYAAGANSYVTKPMDYHRFMAVVRQLDSYWTGLVQLP